METIKEDVKLLFDYKHFDTKKIINRSKVKIPSDVIDMIEKNGVTSEMILDLGVPVYHYRTQITLHGVFDKDISTYLGGYKSLICNKNMSLGIKYNAVDFDKKNRIYKHLKHHFGLIVSKNSTEYCVFRQILVTNAAEYNVALTKLKAILKNIPFDLFYGDANIKLIPTILGKYLVLVVNVGAIFEKNINKFFLKAFGMTEIESNKQIEAKELKESNERDAAYKIEHERYLNDKKIENEILENEIKRLTPIYGEYKAYNLDRNMNVLSIIIDKSYKCINYEIIYDGGYNINYKVTAYKKENRERVFRKKSECHENECDIKLIKSYFFGDKYNYKTTIKGFLID